MYYFNKLKGIFITIIVISTVFANSVPVIVIIINRKKIFYL